MRPHALIAVRVCISNRHLRPCAECACGAEGGGAVSARPPPRARRGVQLHAHTPEHTCATMDAATWCLATWCLACMWQGCKTGQRDGDYHGTMMMEPCPPMPCSPRTWHPNPCMLALRHPSASHHCHSQAYLPRWHSSWQWRSVTLPCAGSP